MKYSKVLIKNHYFNISDTLMMQKDSIIYDYPSTDGSTRVVVTFTPVTGKDYKDIIPKVTTDQITPASVIFDVVVSQHFQLSKILSVLKSIITKWRSARTSTIWFWKHSIFGNVLDRGSLLKHYSIPHWYLFKDNIWCTDIINKTGSDKFVGTGRNNFTIGSFS